MGLATPSPRENINVNLVFQATYTLPTNRSQIPYDILEANDAYIPEAKRKREANLLEVRTNHEEDAKLYHVYNYVRNLLDGYGINGTSCVLRALCELGAEPLVVDDDEDLLHEITAFVLNPTNDVNEDSVNTKEASPYIEAYTTGQTSSNCIQTYHTCDTSLLNIFTKLY